ncbi:DNA-binding protein [Microbulbifer aggregans]|uniref:DNA-binding protein n=1 Tax=Microbulbifer aggregans TaxID=1769779 RepID=UPI001CFE5DB4|nr:DNA-binding protein [Microbulbifer aggregans]
MARSGVGYFDIAQAATTIKERGEEPTVDRVRAELGTGSKSTIAPLLKRWRTEAGDVQTDTHGLPKDLLDALKALHDRVQEDAERKVTQAQSEAAAAVDVLREEQAQLRAVLAERNANLDDLEQKLQVSRSETVALEKNFADSVAHLAKCEFQRDEAANRIIELKSALEELKQENRDVREHFEFFQQRTADDRQQERDQFRQANMQLAAQVSSQTEQNRVLNQRLAEREKLIEELQARNAGLESARQQAEYSISHKEAEIQSLSQKVAIQQEQLTDKDTAISGMQERLASLASDNAARQREVELQRAAYVRLENEQNALAARFSTANEENRQILQDRAQLQGRLNQLERSLARTEIA